MKVLYAQFPTEKEVNIPDFKLFFVATGSMYLLMQVFALVIVERFPIQQDLSLLGFIKPLYEANTGGLATARWTHQCSYLSCGNF